MPQRRMTFLVVAEAKTWAADLSGVLERALPTVSATVVPAMSEAHVFLSASAFDAVFLVASAPDAWDDEAHDAFIRQWVDQVPMVLVIPEASTRVAVEALRAGFVDVLERADLSRSAAEIGMRILAALQQRSPEGGKNEQALTERLAEIRAKASKVHHDVNNPLAIISGNAQLFLELASILGADEDLVQPVRDIEAASVRMADLLHGLMDIKQLTSPGELTNPA
ncbi:MAG: histidine kinase dimerization/phospho-acceptor domain-containing protein [Bacteroidota bacterium]